MLVGLGGAIGCWTRYGLSITLKRLSFSDDFPIATTIANILGSFLIGAIAARVDDRSQSLYLLVAVGFCGGLTTFSSLALELVDHLRKGHLDRFLLEAGTNFALGVTACMIAWKMFSKSLESV
jgi:CrcB protein